MRLLVLGAAVSGLAAARLGRRLGHPVLVYDQDPKAAAVAGLEGFATASGTWDPHLLAGMELVVVSPGIPERAPAITDTLEAGVRCWSEIEFGWHHLDFPVVAVTGTNGKTTVTGLTAAMLTASGLKTAALGNIGSPLCDAVGSGLDLAVVEVSSFQLRFVDAFHPVVAAITNLVPDHLDWHGSFARYLEAKAAIVARQTPGDLCVFDGDDDGASRIAARAPGRKLAVSGRGLPTGGAGVRDQMLVFSQGSVPQGDTTDPSFLLDLVMAGAAALETGATLEAVASEVAAFQPGPHRRTVVAERGGVTFIDDSKATNPHAAAAAIDAYRSVVLIAGGLAKGLDLRPLAEAPNVRRLIAIGTSAPELVEAAGDRGVWAATMEEAVRIAGAEARPGEVVLLAPGCASFDMFTDYRARGDSFATAVRLMLEEDR